MSEFRIGTGSDVHRLVEGRPLIIGGVEIASDVGAEGHSDADVLLHAITDAILGSLALGDIGTHFPNTDERWRAASSVQFLLHAVDLIRQGGYDVVNVDSTVHLERTKLRDHIDEMRTQIANALGIDIHAVSVKAKTGEGVDSVGEGRAIRADASVLIARP
ncbi:MAG: 2-C-methyl-D-erythritol 2,4-cyclodiphosphate synthase [Acidobacteriota bacterium]